MKVGWLADNPGYIGGAEMTQAEFRAAAPEGVKVYDCPPGAIVPGLDAYVLHNVVHYSLDEMDQLQGRVVKYVHDQWPHTQVGVREWVLDNCVLIFCSPLHLQKFRHSIPDWAVTKVVPPALDLDRFRPNRKSRRNGNRPSGACCIAQWRNPGKGAQQVGEWADENEPVDIYGDGEFVPEGPTTPYHGPLEAENVAPVLWNYRTFVFLPTDLEPFGRAVVEAHAARCEVITNDRVGASHYIEKDPEALQTAAEDFWEVVLS